MRHQFRLLLLVALAACAGGSRPSAGPDPAGAQTPQPPKPRGKNKLPPAVPLNTQSLAGQVVGVMPATLVVVRDSLGGAPPFSDRVAAGRWVDSLLGEALMVRAPEVNWKLPAQMRGMARRAPGIAADPDYMGQAALRNPEMDKVPDPLISNLRTLMAIAGGRLVLVPAAVTVQRDSTGAVEAHLNLAAVDTRLGAVVFRSYLVASGATPADALTAAVALLLPAIGVDP